MLLTRLILLTAICCCLTSFVPAQSKIIGWNVITVKDPQQSAAFLDVEDLDDDGFQEILLSTLIEESPPGPPTSASRGALHLFSNPLHNIETDWEEELIISTLEPVPMPFVNEPQVMDVDEDGELDIVIHQGFLTTFGGSHFWIKGPEFEERFDFAPEVARWNTLYFWHETVQTDLDGDGKQDIITTSVQTQSEMGTQLEEKNLRVEWYRHLGNGQFTYHIISETTGGVFIRLFDIDRDEDQDIVVSHFFGPPTKASLVWLENVEAPSESNNYEGVWIEHTIDHTTGLGYRLEFKDINGDGKDELIYCNHNNQNSTVTVDENGDIIPPGIFWFEIPEDPRSSEQWVKHTIYNGFRMNLNDMGNPASQGVPGIFSSGDINGDDRLDLAVPGDGNDSLYLFVQNPDLSFEKIMVDVNEKMFGMAVMTDVDGDGQKEIVAAKHNSLGENEAMLPPGFLKIYQPLFQPLVAEWLDLWAEEKAESVSLFWTMPYETNQQDFIIEKSYDGKTFFEIGKVAADINNQPYQFVDKQPAFGKNYYRIVQKTSDGKNHISNIINVFFGDLLIQVQPNPASQSILIRLEEGKVIPHAVIFNAAGQRVKEVSNVSAFQAVDVSDLDGGVYYFAMEGKQKIRFVKI